MKIGQIAIAVLLVGAGVSASAREFRFRNRVDSEALHEKLVGAGFKITSIECYMEKCTIVMPDTEKKDPALVIEAYVAAESYGTYKKKLAALRALYEKWSAGTITNEEKERLIKQSRGVIFSR